VNGFLSSLKGFVMTLYTQRNSEPPERFYYGVPEHVRSRILHTLQQHDDRNLMCGGCYDFGTMLEEAGDILLAKYGNLRAPGNDAARVSPNPVIQHFFSCLDEEALDFLEACFRASVMGDSDGARVAVEAINRIFEDEGIGYELTHPTMIDTGKPGKVFGRQTGGNAFRIEYPRIIKRDEQTVHQQTVRPALECLNDPRFATANTELLKAFEEIRKHDYADAITSCGSAFESVLRTICQHKKWPFDPKKDTCAKLVEICRANGLFYPLYTEMLVGVGRIRNELGDAHGRGPSPPPAVGSDHAEHMIAVTCSHITFLARQAAI
jgi:hypothetical protein